MLVPPIVHIPLLILTSLTIRTALDAPGSPMALESFGWLPHLGLVDPTGILPVAGGVMAFANAEVVGRGLVGKAARAMRDISSDNTPENPGPTSTNEREVPPVIPIRPVAVVSPRVRRFSTAPRHGPIGRPRPSVPALPEEAFEQIGSRKELERDGAELTKRVVTNAMRVSAVLFIPIAAAVPSVRRWVASVPHELINRAWRFIGSRRCRSLWLKI